MNYMILRDGQEYGPYTLADLQRYVATGEVLLTDMTRSEGMTEFLPVSVVIGTIAVPVAGTHISLAPTAPDYPDPPNLHWALVLLFGVISCGLFIGGWGVALAIWVRKLVPKNRAIFYYGTYAAGLIFMFVLGVIQSMEHIANPMIALVRLVSVAFAVAGRFSLKNAIEEHYNSAENMGVELNSIMTFFFAEIYIQYKLNEIVRRKKLDRMDAFSV